MLGWVWWVSSGFCRLSELRRRDALGDMLDWDALGDVLDWVLDWEALGDMLDCDRTHNISAVRFLGYSRLQELTLVGFPWHFQYVTPDRRRIQ